MDTSEEVTGIARLPRNLKTFSKSGWHFKITKNPILSSKCTGPSGVECPIQSNPDDDKRCPFCVYTQDLGLPHLPDMVFASNAFTVTNEKYGNLSITLNAFDALKLVSNGKQLVEIACAEEWKEYRNETGHTENIHKPFDWTFSTDYKGTLVGDWTVEDTDERIDFERLKKRDTILFFDEIVLFEDELHDNGISQLSVKVRVMPDEFLVLMRYFLRVDDVLVQINDTRFYHIFNTNYCIRECTLRETKVSDLKLPQFLDPNQLALQIPLRKESNQKIILPTAT